VCDRVENGMIVSIRDITIYY